MILKDKYYLAFSKIEEVTSAFVKKIYDKFNDIEHCWTCAPSELVNIEGITKHQIDIFLKKRQEINPDEVFEFIKNKNLKYVTYEDENYPYLLKQISNPPMMLYYKGNFNRCNFDKTIAIVGSRKASQSAKEVLGKIIDEMRGTDICIVSGLALGIDGVAHESAIRNNLSTIGVIASGFDHIYPSKHKKLYEEIENEYGIIFSEYYPSFEPMPWRFPHRNRIVSGLCYGTLVAEAALKSGALITANLTLEQNRELMCMPGNITNPNTEGIYKLLKQGATLVTSASDIFDALNWEIKIEKNDFNSELNKLEEKEKSVFDVISIEDSTFDKISSETNLNFDDLMIILTSLEMKGFIKQV